MQIIVTQAETYTELQVMRIHQWQGSYNFLQFKNNSTIIDHLLYIRLLNCSGGEMNQASYPQETSSLKEVHTSSKFQ